MKVIACLAFLFVATPDYSGAWQRYFAWWPVTVDAYDESERQNGKFSYTKWGWVERRWDVWTDFYVDGSPIVHAYWRYRLDRSKR